MKTFLGNVMDRMHITFFRRLERLFLPDTFHAVIQPYYLARAALNNIFKRTSPAPPMPDFLRTRRNFRARVGQRLHIYLNEVLEGFYDRLAEPRWLTRCEVTGLEHLVEARRAGRPVVLVYWHFGCYPLLPGWLRGGLKYPVVSFVGGLSFKRKNLARLHDQYFPLPELPTSIHPDQLREIVRFVRGTNLIYIAIDVPIGKQVSVPFCDGWNYQLSTGPIRMASHFGADLISCGLTREGPWRYRLTFGRPVPRELLADEADWPQAGKHLLEEMTPLFKTRPEQCGDAMAQRFIRRPDDGAK